MQFLVWWKKSRTLLLWMIVSLGLSFLLLFPLRDLSDWVSAWVAVQTRNQVYVQFSDLHLSLWPTPGVLLEQVSLDVPGLPSLVADELKLRPQMMALLKSRLGADISARGLFRGEVDLGFRQVEAEKLEFQLKAQELQVSDLKEILSLPLSLKGKLGAQGDALLDLSLAQQPNSRINLNFEQLVFPSQMVQTLMGPLGLPEIKASRIDIKAELTEGTLRFDEIRIGKDGEELAGLIKGQMRLDFRKVGQQMLPVPGPYSLEVDLALAKSLQDRAVLFLSFIDQFKVARGTETRYQFKLAATNPQLPPSLTPLRTNVK